MNIKTPAFFSLALTLIVTVSHGQDKTAGQQLLTKYQAVCQTQLEIATSEKELARLRFESVQGLHRGGYASWKEMRENELVFNIAAINEKHLIQFNDFVTAVAAEAEGRDFDWSDSPVTTQVMLPNSKRVLGWIEGFEVDDPIDENQISEAEEELKFRTEAYAAAAKNHNATGTPEKRQIQLAAKSAVAKAYLDHATAALAYLKTQQFQNQNASTANQPKTFRTVRPEQDSELSGLVEAVAVLEADTMRGEIQKLKLKFERENQRLKTLELLATNNHATAGEVQQLKQFIAQIGKEVEAATIAHQTLETAANSLASRTNAEATARTTDYLPVTDWPDAVFENQNMVQYLVQRRKECYAQQANFEIAEKHLQLNQQMIDRLNQAASHFNQQLRSGDQFGNLLANGQKKELDSYHWQQKMLRADSETLKDQIAVLTSEESRFLKQAELMANAPAITSTANNNETFAIELNPQWLSSVLVAANPPTAETAAGTKRISFGYIESNILDTLGSETDLILNQSNRYPIGSFLAEHRSGGLRLASSSAGYYSRSSVRLRVGPNYSGTLIKNSYGSFTSRATRSSLTSPYASNRFHRGSSLGTFQQAYPFGILRSDLRRFTTPGQTPWLLPGSPNNLRYNQLRSGGFYSGSQFLKSRTFSSFNLPYSGRRH